MIYRIKINDNEYEVEVERGRANILNTKNITATQTPSLPSSPNPQTSPAEPVPLAKEAN